ncbi:glycosyltransferase family 92 protein [Microbulbifer sp. ZKSA002]|uniref:glycosyltransferase family 92 protein n=1 Tax=Microbulbifer sp. ZKSA002 TaxID=3243388 RepID=UPI004039BA60
MKVALCAIAKDEKQYLKEWVAYHQLIGFDTIIVYDNESTDGTTEMLQRLQVGGHVDHILWKTKDGVSPQLSAYKDCLERYKDSFDFIAFFDIDEFLFITQGLVREFLSNVPRDISALAINQLVFGSAGIKDNSFEPVLERFTKCCLPNYDGRKWYKSIVRVGTVNEFVSPHMAKIFSGNYVYSDFSLMEPDETYSGKSKRIVADNVFLNHYILKSKQEFFEKKQKRGGAAATTEALRGSRHSDDYFYNRDKFMNKDDFSFSDEFLALLKNRINDLIEI